mmetsp:Transcript_103763/g.288928  ORF Transcript_103763/g.288928 Transcript_103763/m.288928 type:complete len:408 (-) Transcript_103763:231-1454(-)
MGAKCCCEETRGPAVEMVGASQVVLMRDAEPEAMPDAEVFPVANSPEPKTLPDSPEADPSANQEPGPTLLLAEPPAELPAKPEALEPARQRLTVRIVAARGLRNTDWLPGAGKSDCYCIVKVSGDEQELFRTKTINDTLDPIWNEEAKFSEYTPGASLEFSVWDKDLVTSTLLGKAALRGDLLESGGFNGEVQLRLRGKASKAHLKLLVKMPDGEYPAGPRQEATVCIRNPTQGSLGLHLDVQDGRTLYVTDVQAGPVAAHNKKVEHSEQVLPGDFIVQVNGAKGSSATLLEALKTSPNPKMVVRRPMHFFAVVDAIENSPRGVSVKKGCGNSFIIAAIEDGPVKAWNDANPEQEVRAGDRIVAVNGEPGKAAALLQRFTASRCHITVTRPAEPERAAGKLGREGGA